MSSAAPTTMADKDLDAVCKGLHKVVIDRRMGLQDVQKKLDLAFRMLVAVMTRGMTELQKIDKFSHCHQIGQIPDPHIFEDWVQTITFIHNIDEIETVWVHESVYTALSPLQGVLNLLGKGLCIIRQESRKTIRSTRFGWTEQDNHRAMVEETIGQGRRIQDALDNILEPCIVKLQKIVGGLEAEEREVGPALLNRIKRAGDDEEE